MQLDSYCSISLFSDTYTVSNTCVENMHAPYEQMQVHTYTLPWIFCVVPVSGNK